MRNTGLSLLLAGSLAAPAAAQERPLLEQALAAAEIGQPMLSDVGYRRSGARTGLGVALIGVGAALLAIQPSQPSVPGEVSPESLVEAGANWAGANDPGYLAARLDLGLPILVCEPFCIGAIDEAILGSYVAGGAVGIIATAGAIENAPWTLYESAVLPPVEKPAWQLWGGLGAVGAGAVLATALADVPVLSNATFSPEPGGFRVGGRFGW